MQLDAKWLFTQIVIEDSFPSFIFLSKKLLHLCAKGFVTKELLDLHRMDELKNFTANIFLKLVC